MAERPLTARQQAFVREYLKDGNATQAAIRAGFSKKNAANIASKLLKKSQVAAQLATKVERIEAKAEIDAAEVLNEIKRVALVDIGQALDSEGRPLPLDKMPEDVRRAIQGLEVTEIWGHEDDGQGNRGKAVIGQVKKLRMGDKLRALELLGKHLKLFTDVHEHRVSLLDLFDDEEKAA